MKTDMAKADIAPGSFELYPAGFLLRQLIQDLKNTGSRS